MEKYKVIKHLEAKGVNKRIVILLVHDRINNDYNFNIQTKTLVNFKTRAILKTNNYYSTETFFVLSEVMNMFLGNGEIVNKILLKELHKIKKFVVDTNLKA